MDGKVEICNWCGEPMKVDPDSKYEDGSCDEDGEPLYGWYKCLNCGYTQEID